MKKKTVYIGIVLTLFAAFALLLTGCSDEDFSQTLARMKKLSGGERLKHHGSFTGIQRA